MLGTVHAAHFSSLQKRCWVHVGYVRVWHGGRAEPWPAAAGKNSRTIVGKAVWQQSNRKLADFIDHVRT